MITDKNLQKLYKLKVGTVTLSQNTAIAGSKIDCIVTYTVGETGVDDTGSAKVLLPIVTDFGVPQFSDPKQDNYVHFESSNPDLVILPISNASGFPAKIHIRPWSKGIRLVFKNTHLKSGDSVRIFFKNWNVQTFCEKSLKLRVLVDPFATDKFIEVPGSLSLEIIPDKPEKIVIIAPTQVEKEKKLQFLVKAEDRWGNACTNWSGTVSLLKNQTFSPIPQTVTLKNGKALLATKLRSDLGRIQAVFEGKTYTSNPILNKDQNNKLSMFWADLHGQTEETVGTGTITEYFKFARNYSLLDITAHQGNDFQITKKFWKEINTLSKKMTKPGKFIIFPGYEWSGNSSKGGDRNVLYLHEGNTIFRSSHALVSDISDAKTDATSVTELFKKLAQTQHIVMAHVGGRYAEMDVHSPESEKLVEVHSVWGTFEWILFEALNKGYKVGVMANSDGHDGRVGSSYPGFSEFNNYGGLTCILSDQLTRESIFTALRNRQCYATTGNRLFLDKKITIDTQELIMGDEYKIKKVTSAELKLKVCGTQPIDLIEVFDKQKRIYSWSPQPEATFGVKILWSGSKVKGRNRKIQWQGVVTTQAENIKVVNHINFFNPAHTYKKTGKTVTFSGATTGGVQGIVIAGLERTNEVALKVIGQSFTFKLDELTSTPKSISMGGLDAKLELSKVCLNQENKVVELSVPIEIQSGSAIFVKVTQSDGHMAWTSPVFFS